MRRAWQGIAVLFGAATIIASGVPEKPSLPSAGTLEYNLGRVLVEQPVTHVRVASISGSRCFSDLSGTSSDHQFIFDDTRDQVTVTIVDNDGVSPGKSFEYSLYFKRPDGTFKPDSAFRLVTRNPFSATEPAHRFEFVLKVDSADPNLDIAVGTVLGGIYELSESTRDLAVDLRFYLKTDIQFSSACSTYN